MVMDEVRTLDPLDDAQRPDRLWDSTAEDMLARILASERHPSFVARARADGAGRGRRHDRRPGAARPRRGTPKLALQALAALLGLGLLVIGDFDDLDVHLQGVASAEIGERLGPDGLHLLGFERLQQVHFGSLRAAKIVKRGARIAYELFFS